MFEENDYIIREVSRLANFIASMILHKSSVRYELPEAGALSLADRLHNRLKELVGQGKINEAENLLYLELDPADDRGLALAVDFYTQLSELDGAYLEKHDYEQDEILQGLNEAAKLYGILL